MRSAVTIAISFSHRVSFSDLLSLTKPGIVSLLLFSTLTSALLAGASTDDTLAIVGALLGGGLLAAAAGVTNCIFDRDVDALMERTRNRPIPAGRLSIRSASSLAYLCGTLGLVTLLLLANPLSTAVAFFGYFFYAFVYTLWLKRLTVQNIVIGGIAGAIPPLVGWAAVRNTVETPAFLLGLLVFLWTPPHFWALALNRKSDYYRAALPMLPLVAGDKATEKQIVAYTVALLPISILLAFADTRLGAFSLVSIVIAGALFLVMAVRLAIASLETQPERSKQLFLFSILYLEVVFSALIVDLLW